MDFDLSDEQAMVRDGAERVVREHGALERRRARIARGEGFDRELWSQFAELGWLALAIPEEEGGLGGSESDIALLMIELGRGLSTEPIVSSAILCAGLLAEAGWAGRAEWIERIATGEARLAFGHLEAGDRLERAAPRATRLTTRGNELALSGAKLVVLDGAGADAYLVTATDEAGDLAILLVAADAAGLAVDPYPLIDGSRAADLRLDGVAIDDAQVIARGDRAASLIEAALARAIVASLALAVGSMEACLDLCADYLKTRAQFGQPIGKFQALQHIMVDMLVDTHNARSSLYGALSRSGGGSDRARAIAAAKHAVGKAGLAVGRAGIQLHGGYGVTDEYAISHHYRYQMALEKRFGDSRAYADRLAELALD